MKFNTNIIRISKSFPCYLPMCTPATLTGNQGGDWLGSTLVGRIFFAWFGLAKKAWLFGCGLAIYPGKKST